MKCRRFEKMTVEAAGEELGPEDMMRLKAHLRNCSSCARFRDDLSKILESPETVDLPADLDRRTKEKCLTLLARPEETAEAAQRAPGRAVPVWLKAVMVLTVILTTAWVVPLFDLPATGDKVPWEAGAALLILMQNGLALFLSPVVFRRRLVAAGRRGSLSFTKTSA